MKKKLLAGLAISLFVTCLAGISEAVPVSWDYDSKIDVSFQETLNGDNSYTYDFLLTNTDTTAIWFSNIYTYDQEAYNLESSITEWANNAYTQYTAQNDVWNIGAINDNSWFAGFYNDSWPGTALLGVGDTATVSLTVQNQIGDDFYYGYWTQGEHAWNHFTAVGIADSSAPVPEPATMLLFGTGLVGLAGLRRRQSRK